MSKLYYGRYSDAELQPINTYALKEGKGIEILTATWGIAYKPDKLKCWTHPEMPRGHDTKYQVCTI